MYRYNLTVTFTRVPNRTVYTATREENFKPQSTDAEACKILKVTSVGFAANSKRPPRGRGKEEVKGRGVEAEVEQRCRKNGPSSKFCSRKIKRAGRRMILLPCTSDPVLVASCGITLKASPSLPYAGDVCALAAEQLAIDRMAK